MPSRTPAGAELLRRIIGFRTYLETAAGNCAGPTQAADQFSPYLPYAIVFGLTEQWTRAFALVGAPPPAPWYEGREPFSPDRFSSRIDEFASSSAATLSAPPAAVSGSSGFGGVTPGAAVAAPRAAVAVEAAGPGESWWLLLGPARFLVYLGAQRRTAATQPGVVGRAVWRSFGMNAWASFGNG
jgi:hypothetical protein